MQIILSIFLIGIMAFICYSVYNKEYVSNIEISTSTRKTTKVFSGILNYAVDQNIDIETYDKTDIGYLDINPSINQNGGAEYSYNFWLYFDIDTDDSTIIKLNAISNPSNPAVTKYTDYQRYKYIILFYKGEKYKSYLNNKEEDGNYYDCNNITLDFDDRIIIKNPMVKIRNDGKQIVIDYNNINYPDSYNSSTDNINCHKDDMLQNRNNNKFGIQEIDVNKYKQKFNMITIVFREQSDKNNILYSNNANCKIYFNKHLLSDRLSEVGTLNNNELSNFNSRVMKSNFSKLHINPDGFGYNKLENHTMPDTITKTPPLQMADLTYYNYSLNQADIDRLYNMGFNKYKATFIKNDLPKSFKYIKGDFNKTDKTLKQI
jgi:hypothetical protein